MSSIGKLMYTLGSDGKCSTPPQKVTSHLSSTNETGIEHHHRCSAKTDKNPPQSSLPLVCMLSSTCLCWWFIRRKKQPELHTSLYLIRKSVRSNTNGKISLPFFFVPRIENIFVPSFLDDCQRRTIFLNIEHLAVFTR